MHNLHINSTNTLEQTKMMTLAQYLNSGKTVEIGQVVYIGHSTNYGAKHYRGTVQRVTPSGRVVVLTAADVKITFRPDGRVQSDTTASGIYKNDWLEMDVEGVQAAAAKAARTVEAACLLNRVSTAELISCHSSKERMLDEVARLEALLAKAKEAINLI
jgi:hypothetical protein